MDHRNPTNCRDEDDDVLIELGVASVETQGIPVGIDEPIGRLPPDGITQR